MRTSLDMWATILTAIPVGIVLGLLAFGNHGGPRLEPTPLRLAGVAAAALVAGPLGLAVIGPLGWLLCVAAVVGCMTTAAVLRGQRQAAVR